MALIPTRARGRWWWFVVSASLLVGGVVVVGSIVLLFTDRPSAVTVGTVVEVSQHSRGSEGGTSYESDIRVTIDGDTFVFHSEFGTASTRPGDSAVVRYDPTDPVNTVETRADRGGAVLFRAALVFWLLFGALLAGRKWWRGQVD